MNSFEKFDNMLNCALSKKTASNTAEITPVNTKPNEAHVDLTIKDSFVNQKKKNGLFEKFYNKLKCWTNFGNSSKKVDKKIAEYEAGKITKQEVENEIEKYKNSQKNAEQTFGDVVAGATTLGAFFKGKNLLAKLRTQKEIGALPTLLKILNHLNDSSLQKTKPKAKPLLNFAKGVFNSNKKALAVALPVLAIIGAYTKQIVLFMNRIGSKEFKVDKNLKKIDKEKYKQEVKKASRASWKETFKNLGTGALSGILAPLTLIGGGFVGIPMYLASMMGVKYATSGEKDKSFSGFVNSIKDNYAINAIGSAAVALLALRKVRYSSVLQKNLNIVADNLKGVTLKAPKYLSENSNYDTIKDLLLESPSIKNIIEDYSMPVKDKIQRLTQENIFSVKFIQTAGGSDDLTKMLIENCPPSRTVEEAQTAINTLIGSTKYQVQKLLGTGTIAETYLAKDASGKEVCIKILKKGIDAQKIEKDKEAFINIITKGKPRNELTKEQDYLVRCIEDYAEGISKEVDLENEMKAALSLAKVTKKANVAVPIEAKPGIYVMEKANGISVETMREYYTTKNSLDYYYKTKQEYEKKGEKTPPYITNTIKELEQKLENIKAKAPDFEDFNLSNKEIKKILLKYINLQTEQFTKIYSNGKPVHADIHPGNVIINLDALKGKNKGKLFTLIDTGNVYHISKQQSLDMLKFTDWIAKGNIKDLSRSVLENSILPENLTREKAVEIMERELKKSFFDNSTALESMTIENFFKLTDSIQKEYNIINNNTQLNLNKAKNASKNSFKDLIDTLMKKKYGNVDFEKNSAVDNILLGAIVTKDMADIGRTLVLSTKIQEFLNLFKQSPKEILKSLFSRNNPKTNSVEYLTYKFKQNLNNNKPTYL